MPDVFEKDLMLGNGQPDLYGVRGLAIEAIQWTRSHEELDRIRFKALEDKTQEIKICIEDLTKKVEDGFARTDNKFWSLAVTIIGLLISCCAFLIWNLITHGH